MTIMSEGQTDDTVWASVDEARQFAAHLPAPFLACRIYTHKWNPLDDYLDVDNVYVTTLVCMSCRMKKIIERSAISGRRLGSPKYDDSLCKDYYAKGMGRIAGDARDIMALVEIQERQKRAAAKAPKKNVNS